MPSCGSAPVHNAAPLRSTGSGARKGGRGSLTWDGKTGGKRGHNKGKGDIKRGKGDKGGKGDITNIERGKKKEERRRKRGHN